MEPDKTQPNAAPTQRKIERIKSESTPTIYANNVEIQQSSFDFRLRFGLVESATPELVRVRDVVTVYMSPQHAKSVADLLNKQLVAYEKSFGPLKPGPVQKAKDDQLIEQ